MIFLERFIGNSKQATTAKINRSIKQKFRGSVRYQKSILLVLTDRVCVNKIMYENFLTQYLHLRFDLI